VLFNYIHDLEPGAHKIKLELLKQEETTAMASRAKVVCAFAAVYVIWGSTYLAIRYAIETIPPFLMMGVRSIIAGSILYAWSHSKGERVQRDEIRPLIIIGILFFLLGHGLLSWAQKTVASGLAAVLIASDPLWIALIEFFAIKGFRLSKKQIVGLIAGFAGVSLLFLPSSSAGLEMDPVGAFLIVVSAFTWSIGAVYSRIAKLPKSSILASGAELIIGGVFLCVAAVALGELNNFHLSAISVRSLFAIGYLIIFGSVVTFTAYVWLLTVTSATRVATHTYINPVIAVLLGWFFAGEHFTARMLIASVVIVASIYLMLESEKSNATIRVEG
jgi:drug/metabolite transporter (DMT)-like permease